VRAPTRPPRTTRWLHGPFSRCSAPVFGYGPRSVTGYTLQRPVQIKLDGAYMPLNHVSTFSDLTDEQYSAIGRVVVEWSNVEYLLSVVPSRLLRTPEYLGRTYTAGLAAVRIQTAISEVPRRFEWKSRGLMPHSGGIRWSLWAAGARHRRSVGKLASAGPVHKPAGRCMSRPAPCWATAADLDGTR
jgi:hypothetical protein